MGAILIQCKEFKNDLKTVLNNLELGGTRKKNTNVSEIIELKKMNIF